MTSTAAASTRQSAAPPTASYAAGSSIARRRLPPPSKLYRIASATRGSTPSSSVAQNSASVSSIARRSTERLRPPMSGTQIVDPENSVGGFVQLLETRLGLREEV